MLNLYLIGRYIFKIFFNIFYRVKIEGIDNVPKTGGVIIASNHISIFDPPLHGVAMRRPLHFMAKKELFNIPLLGYIIKKTNAFPIDRLHVNLTAIKLSISIVNMGHLLLIFPGGTRNTNMINIKRGIGMISCITQVPLIPAKIINSDKMLAFKQIKIKYGKPIIPPKKFTKNDYDILSKKVLDLIKSM
jgi:1-acyl-sn-glycerol-3-phosphate acyltransferase